MTDKDVSLVEETTTSSSLLERAVARQSDAWDRLVSLYGPLVYHWCRRWGLPPRDVENVGQEVFVKVWRGLNDFRRDRPGDRFRSWLYRIAHNCVADHFRRDHSPPALGGSAALKLLAEVPAQGAHDSPLESEDQQILYRQAVDLIRREFSERDWVAFQAVVLEDKSPAEVASSLGVTTNVVYLARSRVLGRLRTEFAGLIEF